MAKKTNILVVGAGIAGSAIAILLGRAGHAVTLVERDESQRTSGSPVDLREHALQAMAGMGLLEQARRSDTGVRAVSFVDASGRTTARAVTRGPRSPEVEISRNALGGILGHPAREVAEVRMGDGPVSIHRDLRARVKFASGREDEYDLVIGADGQHSTVRRLVWGDASRFTTGLGLTIATAPLPAGAVGDRHSLQIFNEPGRSVAIHPAGGKPVVAFIFRPASVARPRDRAGRLRVLRDAYADGGWRTRELLELAADADDLYYDAVTRIRTPEWSRGPVVLLGDAAGSLTILGEGSSMALIGATRLQSALAQNADARSAVLRYESGHRPLVESKQRGARLGAATLVPATRTGIALRDLLVRVTRRV